MHIVAEFIPLRLQNDFKGVAFVVRKQIFIIFQHKCLRPFGGNDMGNIKKQGAVGRTFKTMRMAQRIFLENTGNAKRLTGKAIQQ
jgi:hypothetical protein